MLNSVLRGEAGSTIENNPNSLIPGLLRKILNPEIWTPYGIIKLERSHAK